jgi:hypothetical protein
VTELIKWLNSNQGAVLAGLTLVYVFFTGALLLEARSGRREKLVASVEAYPMPYEMASMYLAGRLENGFDEPHRYAQPMMAAGRYHTMMLHERGRSQMLRGLADEGTTFGVEWAWKDGRRWFGVGPHRTHRRTTTWDAKQLAEDFYQANVLTETPPMLKVGEAADEVKKAAKEVERIRRELESMRTFAERAAHREPAETGPGDD